VGRNGSAPARSEERALEQNIYDISSTSELDSEFETLPSELPRLGAFEAGYVYIVNLDREVLTMNYSIHWNLGNIPRVAIHSTESTRGSTWWIHDPFHEVGRLVDYIIHPFHSKRSWSGWSGFEAAARGLGLLSRLTNQCIS
jgi:hypothetical protein